MVPVAHGGSATAYLADVVTPQASPLTNEMFAVTDPGGRDTFVWMQNAEPISLFCADEDRRRVAARLRADHEVAVRLRDQRHGRRAGAGGVLRSERGPDRLDLHAAPGRQVP